MIEVKTTIAGQETYLPAQAGEVKTLKVVNPFEGDYIVAEVYDVDTMIVSQVTTFSKPKWDLWDVERVDFRLVHGEEINHDPLLMSRYHWRAWTLTERMLWGQQLDR